MTRTVVATFTDAGAARRAAVALGRAELAAGPTRVQVDASAPERGARLELRVDESDARRAIALMREHGAAVAERGDAPEVRGGGPLAAWGMAVADAATAAMGGATASDARVPARAGAPASSGASAGPAGAAPIGTTSPTGSGPATGPADGPSAAPSAVEAGADPGGPGDAPGRPGGPVVWGNAPTRGAAGSGSGTHLSDTVAAGTASSMGQTGPGSTLAAAMGATDDTGTASGTRTRAQPGTLERADDVPIRDPRPRRRRPKSEA